MTSSITVKIRLREGEYGPAGRFEFPDRSVLDKLLESFTQSETGRFRIHSFNNILVCREFPEEFKVFLSGKAKMLGLELVFSCV